MSQTRLKVLGFDLGTVGSVAALQFNFREESLDFIGLHRWNYGNRSKHGIKPLKLIEELRYHRFYVHLINQIEVSKPDAIGYEHVQFNRGFSVISGLRAILHAVCEDRGILCYGVNVSVLKAFASHGQASKEEMAVALALENPLIAAECQNDNDVDACWVCLWVGAHAKV